MDFSGIQKGVHDVWQFLWPALVIVILLGGIAALLAREPLAALGRRLLKAQNSVWGNRAFYKTLRRFELIKLIPLITLFLIIFFLYVTREAADRVGNVLPGHISYSPGPLLAHTSNPDDLTRLWACFPTVDNLDTLAAAIDQHLNTSAEAPEAAALSGVRYWREENGRAARGFNVVKTFVVWSLLCAAVGLWWTRRVVRVVFRLALCLLLLAPAGAHYLAKQVYAIEQRSFAEARAAQIVIVPAVARATPLTEEGLKAAREKVDRELAGGFRLRGDWWSFRILDSYYFGWMRRTFFDRP